MLSAAERDRHDETVEANRDGFLAGRLVLRGLAAQLLSVSPIDVPLVATCPDCGGPHGRPEILGSSLRVSLSHGAGVVVAAAVWGSAVGVDVESAVVSPERVLAIGELAGRASVQHWTRVEAVVKADGRGLRVDPSRVTVEGDRGWIDGSAERYELSEVDLAPGVRVSVAVAG